MSLLRLTKTAFASGDYYKSMNEALKSINGDYHMLHYPFYEDNKHSFSQAQNNLIEYCIKKFSVLTDKDLLDIGCGNGVVALYVSDNYLVNSVIGVDINANNVKIANEEKKRRNKHNVNFLEGDAQNLSQIKSNSIDIIINIESAFHYPQKELFTDEIYRILKPGGQFVIADILTTKKENRILKSWKKNMNYHHWSYEKYRNAFNRSNLKLLSNDDITDKVILGFKMYKNYFKEFSKNGNFRATFIKLFLILNIKLNVRLLKTKRRYTIFLGEKEI
ncbi:MAG: class I SAM-dependent methyltransferase [Melioribacteraceae bacterium]|nr:class I SAM-dependent methyltransferase [Melioribacteraceae bacterium]